VYEIEEIGWRKLLCEFIIVKRWKIIMLRRIWWRRAAGMRRRCSRGDVVISTTRIGVSFNSFVTEQRGRRKVL
jgi:hypothetical protein